MDPCPGGKQGEERQGSNEGQSKDARNADTEGDVELPPLDFENEENSLSDDDKNSGDNSGSGGSESGGSTDGSFGSGGSESRGSSDGSFGSGGSESRGSSDGSFGSAQEGANKATCQGGKAGKNLHGEALPLFPIAKVLSWMQPIDCIVENLHTKLFHSLSYLKWVRYPRDVS